MLRVRAWLLDSLDSILSRIGLVRMSTMDVLGSTLASRLVEAESSNRNLQAKLSEAGASAVHAAHEHVDIPAIKMVDGVELVSLEVWTDGKKPCDEHKYHKVRAMNSHKGAIARSLGKAEHLDYTCSKCTHGLCVTNWGRDVRAGS